MLNKVLDSLKDVTNKVLKPIKPYLDSVGPFFVVGFAIAMLIGFLFIVINVVLWGFVIGFALWCIYTLKGLVCNYMACNDKGSKKKGVVIDHDKVK